MLTSSLVDKVLSKQTGAPVGRGARLRILLSWFQEDSFSTSPLRRAPYPLVAVLLAIAHLGCTKMGWLSIAGGHGDAGLARGRIDIRGPLLFGTRYWPILLAANLAGILQEEFRGRPPWEPR